MISGAPRENVVCGLCISDVSFEVEEGTKAENRGGLFKRKVRSEMAEEAIIL